MSYRLPRNQTGWAATLSRGLASSLASQARSWARLVGPVSGLGSGFSGMGPLSAAAPTRRVGM